MILSEVLKSSKLHVGVKMVEQFAVKYAMVNVVCLREIMNSLHFHTIIHYGWSYNVVGGVHAGTEAESDQLDRHNIGYSSVLYHALYTCTFTCVHMQCQHEMESW